MDKKVSKICFVNIPTKTERLDLQKRLGKMDIMYERFLVIFAFEVLTGIILFLNYFLNVNASFWVFLMFCFSAFVLFVIESIVVEVIKKSVYSIDETEIRKILERCKTVKLYQDFYKIHTDVDVVLGEKGTLILSGRLRTGTKEKVKLNLFPSKVCKNQSVLLATYDVKTGVLKFPSKK